MSETLADTLRRWLKGRKAMDDAGWSVQDASTYLRGHDDRQPEIDALTAEVEKWKGRYYDVADAVARESTGVEDLCRQARQTRETCDALTARVRELEAQPAAVGVVVTQAMVQALIDKFGYIYGESEPWRDVLTTALATAQIVPLASAEPVGTQSPKTQTVYGKSSVGDPLYADCAPVYPGIAQPAQEREG
jgi:BMFP domain-containing protein YqiC